MSDFDWVRIGLSSIGAGGVAILVTLAIERFGGRLGGILGTIPTTIVPASWGLWFGGQMGTDGQKAFEIGSLDLRDTESGDWNPGTKFKIQKIKDS